MVRNFLFHRVNPHRDELWDPMDVDLFDRSIKYISKKYTVVLFEELALTDEIHTSKNKYATIMFDDGYKDNIEFAAPILKKHGVKASFYIVTNCINENIPTWTNILDYSFQNTSTQELHLNFDFLPENVRSQSFNDPAEKINYAKKIKPLLKELSHNKRQLVLDEVMTQFKDVSIPQIMMNWDDLKILKAEGHYIGSHSVNHYMLGTITNQDEIKHELLQSAKEIEAQLGHFPITISYPIGSFNALTKTISKEVGYQIGLAVKQNVYSPSKDDLFEVSRIELYNEPWWKVKLRISNSLEKIKSLIRYK